MRQARTRLLLPVAVALGVLAGYVGARVLFVGSGLSLIPWAVIALALGAVAAERAWLIGAVFGAALAYVFMLASYDGAASIASRLGPFLAFAAVGAVCGAALAAASALVLARFSAPS